MVGSTTNRISYNVTSVSTAPLAVDYRFDDSSWLQVRYVETGAETSQLLTIGTHYTVSGDGTAIEGTVTLTSGFLDTITSGELVIARFTPAFQEVNLEYNTRFPAVSVENQMDETVMALQDRTDSDFQAGSRAIYLPPNEPTGNPNTLPLPSFRKGKFFAFDSATGAIEMLSNEDAAIRILQYYGLTITSDDVLAAISAMAPIERFTPPDTSTLGKFGQLAIIPEHVEIDISGTLNPDITGHLLPWKYENGKLWFSTDGVDPETLTSTPLSVAVGWSGSNFGITPYENGVAPIPAQGWLSLNGNSSTYPNDVTSWLNVNTTGQPDIAISGGIPARVWINLAPSDTTPNWKEVSANTKSAYFDRFVRENTIEGEIGISPTGHEYEITGAGADAIRIYNNALEWGDDRELTYIRPIIDFLPRTFGTQWNLRVNPDAVSSSYVQAMLMSRDLDALEPMLHCTWNANTINLSYWPGGGPGMAVNYFVRNFVTPLARDGVTDYGTHMEFLKETNQVILTCPDGHVEMVDFPELSLVHSPYIRYESGEEPGSVLITRWKAAWAEPYEDVVTSFSPMIEAAKKGVRKYGPMFDIRTDRIAAGFLPLAPVVQKVNMAATAWANTLVGTGGASISPSAAITTRAGNGGDTSSLMRNNENGNTNFLCVPGQSFTTVPWAIPARFDILFCIQNTSSTAIHRILFGTPYDQTTVNDLGVRGIGIKVENLSLKIQTHNGTTLTNSASVSTLTAGTSYLVSLQTDGAGGIVAFLNGVQIHSATGVAPTTFGSANHTSVACSSASGANTEYAIMTTTQIEVITL